MERGKGAALHVSVGIGAALQQRRNNCGALVFPGRIVQGRLTTIIPSVRIRSRTQKRNDYGRVGVVARGAVQGRIAEFVPEMDVGARIDQRLRCCRILHQRGCKAQRIAAPCTARVGIGARVQAILDLFDIRLFKELPCIPFRAIGVCCNRKDCEHQEQQRRKKCSRR